MKKLNIISFFFSIIVFFLPIWRINFKAPQFPQSLGIYFYLYKIKEEKKNDIYNIDILNHYIGIKKIKSENFNELKIITILFIVIMFIKLIELSKKEKTLSLNIIELIMYNISIVIALFCVFKYNNIFFKNIDKRAPYSSLMEESGYRPPILGKKKIGKIEIKSYPEIVFFFVTTNFFITIIKIIKKKKNEK